MYLLSIVGPGERMVNKTNLVSTFSGDEDNLRVRNVMKKLSKVMFVTKCSES